MADQPKKVYLLLLPGKEKPQELDIGTGWTGYGLKNQIIANVTELKGRDPNDLRLFIGQEEIRSSETVPPGQEIKVVVEGR